MNSCKKTDFAKPPFQAHFIDETGKYFVEDTVTNMFKVNIGLTQPAATDTKVSVSVSSKTGAQVDSQYTLSTKDVIIPAGQTIGSFIVKGIYSSYTTGRIDTLQFTINGNGSTGDFNQTFTLQVKRSAFCSVNLSSYLGAYPNTNEVFGTSAYGPYTTTITAANQLTATTGTITVANIFDAGWNPINFNLDWTDQANPKITVPTQSGIGDAGTLNTTYTGQDISVRAFTGETGTFSSCDKKFTVVMQLGVTGVGWFTSKYTVIIAK